MPNIPVLHPFSIFLFLSLQQVCRQNLRPMPSRGISSSFLLLVTLVSYWIKSRYLRDGKST